MHVPSHTKQAACSIVVTRADGTVEDLGIVAYTAESPEQQRKYALLKARGQRIDEAEFFGKEGE